MGPLWLLWKVTRTRTRHTKRDARATCGFAIRSRGSLRSPLEMRARPQATIRQSGNSILGGASCKCDFCILLCSLRELKMQRIRCNFKRSWCIARSNRAKSKGYCLLEFKENYGIFRIGQFRSSFDRECLSYKNESRARTTLYPFTSSNVLL